MKRVSRRCGIAGLILLLLGVLGYGMAPQFKGFHVIPWFLALVCLAVYAAFHGREIRAFLFSRGTRYGAGSLISAALVLGIITFIAILTVRHNARYDLTENQRFSLAPQTVKILEGLTLDVQVSGFYQSEGAERLRAKDLLERYAEKSDRFKFELIDPDRQPGRTKAAGVTKYDTVVVRAGEESEKLKDLSEQTLTNAILRVTRPGKKVLYFLTGHGEKDLEETGKTGFSGIKTVLEGQNYQVKPLLLMERRNVPSDCAALVLAAPLKHLLPKENEALDRFFKQGGKVLFLVDPETSPELVGFLARYGVKVGEDVIVDKMSRLFGADYLMPLITQYTQHAITENFKVPCIFPIARSVSKADTSGGAQGVTVKVLALTGKQSWGETDLARLNRQGKAKPDEGVDLLGPVPVAVVGEIKAADEPGKAPAKKPGRFIVFGDSDFVTNAYKDLQGNGDLFTSAIGWLAEEDDLVAVRAKRQKSRPLFLTATQARLVFWLPVAALPLLILVIGALVLGSRRERS